MNVKSMQRLNAEVLPQAQISEAVCQSLYELYNFYYDGTNWTLFKQDFRQKDYVILLKDETQKIQGFSTLAVIEFEFAQAAGKAIFSGDTIIHQDYWGEQTLAIAWSHLAGKIKAQAPNLPLYWFLIVKGYRTYRYLPIFGKTFYPTWRYPTPAKEQALMDFLAQKKFGKDYDPQSGLIRFPQSHGHLRSQWATIKTGFEDKPDIRYFLTRNPNYHQGHELVCLMELSAENMRSHAKRAFLAGLSEGSSLLSSEH